MPYKTVKQDCTRSDGKKGKYVLKYKPKKPTSKKKDSQGFVKPAVTRQKRRQLVRELQLKAVRDGWEKRQKKTRC